MEGNNLYYPKYFKQGLWWLIVVKNSLNITRFLNKDIIKKIFKLIVWSPIKNKKYSKWLDRMEKDIFGDDLKKAKQVVYDMITFETVYYHQIIFYFDERTHCFWDGHSEFCDCGLRHRLYWFYDKNRNILIQKEK